MWQVKVEATTRTIDTNGRGGGGSWLWLRLKGPTTAFGSQVHAKIITFFGGTRRPYEV